MWVSFHSRGRAPRVARCAPLAWVSFHLRRRTRSTGTKCTLALLLNAGVDVDPRTARARAGRPRPPSACRGAAAAPTARAAVRRTRGPEPGRGAARGAPPPSAGAACPRSASRSRRAGRRSPPRSAPRRCSSWRRVVPGGHRATGAAERLLELGHRAVERGGREGRAAAAHEQHEPRHQSAARARAEQDVAPPREPAVVTETLAVDAVVALRVEQQVGTHAAEPLRGLAAAAGTLAESRQRRCRRRGLVERRDL